MQTENKYSNDDLGKILGRLLDGIIIVGKTGKISYANLSAATLFNKSTQDLIGQEFGYIIIPQKVQDIQIVQEQRILFVQMLASSMEWNGEESCLISLRDVTELKKGELDLQVERQKLEQTNAELAQYASMASHDLREPVRKIMTLAQMLMDEYSSLLSQEPFRLIEKMHKSAGRLRSIIDGVSKFSTIRNIELQLVPVDLNLIIQQVADDIEILLIEKKAQLQVENLPMVNGDASLLYQLFLNLITNAIKYSKLSAPPLILVSGKLQSGTVTIEIQDNGIGFENKYAEKIFEPFQRLMAHGYDGTGIGLAICKKVVETHKGKITAESVPDLGTKITIELPQIAGV